MFETSALIPLLRLGDRKAFDDVYRSYFKPLYLYCITYVSASDAEEIVQDTMMWLWNSRDTLIEELNLKNLLFTIVRNKALNLITRNQTKSRIYQEVVDRFESEFSDPDFYIYQELLSLYKEAISKLPQDLRITFEMNRVEGLTHKEIAEKLGISPQTVNFRIGQVLKVLRVELKDYLPLVLLLIEEMRMA